MTKKRLNLGMHHRQLQKQQQRQQRQQQQRHQQQQQQQRQHHQHRHHLLRKDFFEQVFQRETVDVTSFFFVLTHLGSSLE